MRYGGYLLKTEQYAAYYRYASAESPDLVGMLTPNAKIGDAARVFNLPFPATCCGASVVCRGRCYALGLLGDRLEAGIEARAEKNFRVSQRKDFPYLLAGAIESERRIRFVKAHGWGDFFGADYIRAWAHAADLCPGVAMWAYTRAWRVPELLAPLAELASRPNFSLLLSADRDTKLPPAVPGTRVAWLADTDFDCPPAPVFIVFRGAVNCDSEPLVRMADSLVCPTQNGTLNTLTCDRCKYCIRKENHLQEEGLNSDCVV